MFDRLADAVREVSADGPVAVALYDYQTGTSWAQDGERWFHAASTIKVAVLAALYATLEARDLTPWHRLHVRNRFFSAADGSPYRILASRDADADVYTAIGRTMRIGELAKHMIATSSNLATNVLLDYVSVPESQRLIAEAGVTGVDLVRGVEDDRAFDAGLSNRVTASGLVSLLRAIFDGRFGGVEFTAEMIEILCAQAFNSGIPAGLPAPIRAVSRVAHKTGEITTVTHDAGLVFLPGRPPYALAILTEHATTPAERFERIARLSGQVFEAVATAGARAAQPQ
jgi:beta-lactamase class A